MTRVTVYVNGRLAKRITVKSTATRVTTKLPTPVATSKIVVKVTFAPQHRHQGPDLHAHGQALRPGVGQAELHRLSRPASL